MPARAATVGSRAEVTGVGSGVVATAGAADREGGMLLADRRALLGRVEAVLLAGHGRVSLRTACHSPPPRDSPFAFGSGILACANVSVLL